MPDLSAIRPSADGRPEHSRKRRLWSFLFYRALQLRNFRTSYRRIDGISYTIYPGEWVCTLKEVSQWFRTRFQCQALTVLEQLQKQHFITFQTLDRGNVIRYKICDWARHNTVLEYMLPAKRIPAFSFYRFRCHRSHQHKPMLRNGYYSGPLGFSRLQR